MAKVVYASLKPKKSAGKTSVATVRVVGSDGKRSTVYKLDANSRTLDEDLSFVFKKNVEKARRTNKKILGSTDRAPGGK